MRNAVLLVSKPNWHKQCAKVPEIPSSGVINVGYYCLQRVLIKNNC